MDDVKEFSNELNSLYNVKPPISRAKMTTVTRLALKSLKHYKHVVQSIERFIHKCQAEYKLPGLYVIDSIVRQSRHQYGTDKDPFAGRFSKNIAVTFHDLLMCPPQEICKIVRVLNLWQKNNMFSPQIIQPLLDMAANPTNHEVYMTVQKAIQQVTGQQQSSSGSQSATKSFGDVPPTSDLTSGELNPQPVDLMKALSNQLLLPLLANPQLYLQLLQQQVLLQQASTGNLMPELQQSSFVPQIDGNLMAQIQALTAALMTRVGGPQQQSNQQAVTGLVSNLDTTTNSFESSDFHGEVTSPVFSNKKAGMSDIMSDIEDDKVVDQMSISSISTPAINTTDGAFASCPAYSPSGDHIDGGQLVTSSTHHVTSSGPASKAQTTRDGSLLSSGVPSFHPEMSSLKSNNRDDDDCAAAKSVSKNEYSLFSPVSPINSVPNSPSEQSGTPVLDEIPSPRYGHDECRALTGEKNDRYVDESSKEQYADNSGMQMDSTNDMEVLDELQQTPEEGEILATEVEGCDGGRFDEPASRPISERHKRKRSKRSKEGKRERSKVVTSTVMYANENVKKSKLRTDSSSGRNKKESRTIKREKESKKKRKRNKERQSDSKADVGRSHRRSSSSMAEHTLVVEDEPRRYFVVLDELPAPSFNKPDVKKSKRKRSQSPEQMIIHSEAHVSRRDLYASRKQKSHEKPKTDVSEDAVKDKKRRKHSKDDSRKAKNISSSIDRSLAMHSSLVTSNGPSHHHHHQHHHSNTKKERSKSLRKKSPRKELKIKESYSKDKIHELQKTVKPKNRIYRAKSVSAEPLPTVPRKSKSRSKEKKSARKDASSKRSKQSPVKQKERSSSDKKVKSKSSGKLKEEKEPRRDKSKAAKEEEPKKHSTTSLSSSSDNSKENAFKKKKHAPPSIRDKHACICSTTLWIGPISRHIKKDELKKELHKYSRPTLIDVVVKQSCVYVAFDTREEAIDLMEAINNTSLCGKTVKVTWAPGSGIKQSKFLSRWDVDAGATHIPWDKLPSNMDAITQGGVLVSSSMPLRSKVVSDVDPEIKEKEVRVKDSSDCPVQSFNLNEDVGSNDVLSEKDQGGSSDDDNVDIKKQLSEIKLPLASAVEEIKPNETSTKSHDESSNEVNLSVEDLSAITLPPSIVCESKAVESVSVDAILVRDEEEEEEDVARTQTVQELACEAIKPMLVVEDDEDCESLKDCGNVVNMNRFSFSIENSDKNEIVKKVQDFDADVDSVSDDKNSEVDDASQMIENTAAKLEVEKKTSSKANKPEILKGKIKFGVISAFSGWANRQKLSAAASSTPVVTNSHEEKQKEDARTLYETLMERINAKSSKASKQIDNSGLTYNEEFLRSIKVPSPKPVLTSKAGDDKKSEDMSEVYDPFENYSDSGNSSPVNKNMPVSSQTNESLKMVANPLVNSLTAQSFNYLQAMGPLQRPPFPLNADNNFTMPPYHQQPPLPQNNSFGHHPMPIKNAATPATRPMVMPMGIPQHAISPAPMISNFQNQKSLGASNLSAPPSFRAQEPVHPQSKLQLPFAHPLRQMTPNSLNTSNFTANATNSGMNSSLKPPVQSFNVPPPGLPLNRPTNPLFVNALNNPNNHSNPSMVPQSNVDSFVYPQSLPAMNNQISSAVVTHSQVSHNISNNPFELQRRPPLLSKPTDGASHLNTQVQADMHSMKSLHNTSISTAPVQKSLLPNSVLGNPFNRMEMSGSGDWCSSSLPNSDMSNSNNISHSTSSQPPSFLSPRDHFIANSRINPLARNTINHQDYTDKEIVKNNDNQWMLPKSGDINYGINSVERKFLQTPAMSQSIEVGINNDFKRTMNVNISNELGFNTQRSDHQNVRTSGEQVYNIESVVPTVKHLKNEEGEQCLNSQNSFREPMVGREKFPSSPGFFNVPPPAAQNIRGSINSLSLPPPRPLLSSVGLREPRAGAQEFSKLLNSPVTFDGFSKNILLKDNIRLIGNPIANPNFIQRPATQVNDGLLGPPPPNNFNPINKMTCPPPPPPPSSVVPNNFNRNFPPPPLPQQHLSLRNVSLLPSPVDRNPSRNPELRFRPHPPPLINPNEFLGFQQGQKNEHQFKQARFDERDFGRRGRSFEGEGDHHPMKPFDNSRGHRNWYGGENGNRGAPRY